MRSPAKPAVVDAGELAETITREHPEVGALLLAVGGFGSPIDAPCDRVGVFAIVGAGLVLLADAWVREAQRDDLVAALRDRCAGLRVGAWDVLYATAWGYAWTADGLPFALWDRRGCVASASAAGLHRRGDADLARATLTAVEVRLSDDWSRRSVEVVGADGRWTVVAEESLAPAVDPTYDGIDLMVDLGWLIAVGRALAQALALPLRDRTGEV
ncbi:MAG: hypothetical protein KC486_08560 [Myxococcales bacterium]|nr:hypothetical protein [Myxococcales bacterium]